MRRASAAVAMTAAAALALSACSGGESGGTGGGDGPVTISFASHIAGIDGAVEAFNESQDDIVVEFEQYPSPAEGGLSKLVNGIKAGNAPDLATVEYPDLPFVVSTGGIKPVSETNSEVLGELPDSIRDLVTFADDQWAVPYDATPMVYYYRADVYKKLGLEVPETWEQFRKNAEIINKEMPGTAIASLYPNEPKILAGLAWQAGANWFGTEGDTWQVNMTGEATTKVAEFWQGMIEDGTVRYQQAFSEDWANDLDSGNVVGVIGAVWGVAGLVSRTESSAGDWRVAELPSWDGKPASAIYGGSTFVVTDSSEHAEAAAEFATWLATSPEGLEARGDFGVAYPANPDLLKVARDSVDTSHFGGQEIYDVFDAAYESIVPGWMWGPVQGTWQSLSDELGNVPDSSTISDALQASQDATVAEMNELGLSVQTP